MARNDLVEIVPFAAADKFIEALRPTAEPWRARPAYWIFRGQADASWKLVPSANRRANLRKFLRDVPAPEEDELYWEPSLGRVTRLLVDFAMALGRAGYEIPGKNEMQTDQQFMEFLMLNPLASELDKLVALAQHHGIPTRLLDWTHYANVAAYFAASDIVNAPDDGGDLAVWAFNITDTRGGYLSMFDEKGAQMRIVTPSRAGNPNLHAQAGLFTLVTTSPLVPSEIAGSKVKLVTLDEIVGNSSDAAVFTVPRFYKLTLPKSEAGALLKWLALEPVTGAMLFPGLDGVAREVRDRRHWRK